MLKAWFAVMVVAGLRDCLRRRVSREAIALASSLAQRFHFSKPEGAHLIELELPAMRQPLLLGNR